MFNNQTKSTAPNGVLNPSPRNERTSVWKCPAVIAENHFVHKSLSQWAFNPAVGCKHGCTFCSVPSTSTNKLGPQLRAYGVDDPDEQWGEYVLLRPWEETKFLASLRRAENTPLANLKPDGNRAVIFSSTTDAYQIVHHPDAARRKELNAHARFVVRRALELIRDRSTLNVRILTRSPLARQDFDLFRSLGHRVLFGMSLPTLRNDLARVYEPNAPSPSQRLATLRAANETGIPVYVAMAPTYPECDAQDLRATLTAIADVDPVTVFHEPINIRAENVARIRTHAQSLGISLETAVFEKEAWPAYAIAQLQTAERIAGEVGLGHCFHPWPDKALGTNRVLASLGNTSEHVRWLDRCWARISAWPSPKN